MKNAGTTGRSAERALLRQREILKIAREHFLALPYSQVSVETIAAMVGVSKVTVYSYFASKLEIYCAILTDDATKLLDAFEGAADAEEDIASNIRSLSDAYADFFDARPEYFRHFSWYFLPGREERLPAEVGTLIGRTFEKIQAVIERCLVSACERGQISSRDFKLAAAGIYAQWVGLAYLRTLNTPESGRGARNHTLVRRELDALSINGLMG